MSERVYRLEEMSQDHISGVVALHLALFSGDYAISYNEDFFNNMGKKYLTLFFTEFCLHDFNFGVVAIHKTSKRVIGVSISSANIEKQYANFYSKHFPIIAFIFLSKILTNKVIRSGAKKKIASMKRAINMLISKRGQHEREFMKTNSAYLMYIAVAREFQRTGIANAMMDFMIELLRDEGIAQVHASVNGGNLQGSKFFETSGWKILSKTIDGIIYGSEIKGTKEN